MPSSTDPAHFRKVRSLFHQAVSMAPGERVRFLESIDEAELRSDVEALLEADARPSAVSQRVALASEAALPHPDRIAGYRIVEVLGRGGMGVVYRARQDQPRRDVALKLLRPALFTGAHHVRFRREVEILARLQHPGIAQVYEAGTADFGYGEHPWFAMELVDGSELSRWAEGRSTAEKLGLAVQLCEALEHAHQRGVVHRDLKPENVLVTAEGRVKVLDFGVACVLGEDRLTSIRTGVQSVVGTLPYMSPEQALGELERVGPAADVYSLGVLIYEMLAGAVPLDLAGKSLAEAARVIAEEDPRPLSEARPELRGDLDTVLGMALEKDPERRYASAAELGADVERHLRGEPVRAHPPSTWYQLTKLARRNRRLFVAVAAAFLALLAGAVSSAAFAVREARAREAAEAETLRSQKVVGMALGLLSPSELQKSSPSPVALLEHAAGRVDAQLADQPDLAGDFYMMLGRLYKILDEQGRAREVLEQAVARHREVAEESPEKLLESLRELRGTFVRRRDSVGLLALAEELVEMNARVHGPASEEAMTARVFQLQQLSKAGDHERACALVEGVVGRDGEPLSPEWQQAIGAVYYRAGRFREAREWLEPLLEVPPASVAGQGKYALSAHLFAAFQLAGVCSDSGDLQGARRATARMAELAPFFTFESGASVYSSYMEAHVLQRRGRIAEAVERAREALEIFERSGKPSPVFAWRELGAAELQAGLLENAVRSLREYLARQSALEGDGPWYVAQAEAMLGDALRARGKLDEAFAVGAAGLADSRASLPAGHPRIADALEPLARTALALGRLDEAEALIREAIEIRAACMDPEAFPVSTLRLLLGEVHAARGDGTLAWAAAEAAREQLVAALPDDHPLLVRSLQVLARCAAVADRPDAETRWRDALAECERVLGHDHPETAATRAELGLFLLAAGNGREAEAPLRGAEEALEVRVGATHPLLGRVGDALARFGGAAED